jgi:hypothetical protein
MARQRVVVRDKRSQIVEEVEVDGISGNAHGIAQMWRNRGYTANVYNV